MKRNFLIIIAIVFVVFLGWRFIRPMNIFIVSPAFERPIDTSNAPVLISTLSAKECAACHQEFYDEWKTSIHAQAWIDPYFQVDWAFDGSPQICKNCHIPLDRQQEYLVLGFNDPEKWDPILEPNPDFDEQLQNEGVTCNACHLRNGKIVGVSGDAAGPHLVETIDNANLVCISCHVVSGERWDTFFHIPPCGTVAEIKTAQGKKPMNETSSMNTEEISALGCVGCHMPLVERAIVPGGKIRQARQHTWRGGHDPEMVKSGLTINLKETTIANSDNKQYSLSISNTGAAHYIPTGTPDRHLTVKLLLLDGQGRILEEVAHILKRWIMWRPFIVDLWDTRLPQGETREFKIDVPNDKNSQVMFVEAQVTYHLLDEARRKRIGYENKTPINYPVFKQRLSVLVN